MSLVEASKALISPVKALYGRSKQVFTTEDLHGILNYHDRLARIAPKPVDSHAGKATPMMFVTSKPGKYVGLGNCVWEVIGRELTAPRSAKLYDGLYFVSVHALKPVNQKKALNRRISKKQKIGPSQILSAVVKTRCYFCGCKPALTRDHLIPRCKGGKKTVRACETCNRRKGSLLPEQFKRKVGWQRFWAEEVLLLAQKNVGRK